MDNRKKIDFFAHLPLEVSMDTLINHMVAKEMLLAASVSTTWQTLFTAQNSWQNKLARDFDIPKSITAKAFNELKKSNGNAMPAHAAPHQIYQRLARLERKHEHLPKYVSFTYANRKEHEKILLACMTDDVNYAMQIIPEEEYPIWLHISLFAGCVNVPFELLNKMKTHNRWDAVAASGNLAVLKKIHTTGVYPTIKTLIDAARIGSLPCLEYLLDENNNFKIELTEEVLDSTQDFACSKFLTDYASKYQPELIDDMDEDDNMLALAATAADMFSAPIHVHVARSTNSTKSQVDLEFAALESNLHEVKDLINTHKLRPDDKTLCLAVKSGNLDLVRFLLDPENEFNLHFTRFPPQPEEYGNNPILRMHILLSAHSIHWALIHYKKGLLEDFQYSMTAAQTASPLHFDRCIKHMLTKPEFYGFKEDVIAIIKEFAATKNIENKSESQPSGNNFTHDAPHR